MRIHSSLLIFLSLLMIWSCAVAEDFSFRNGITFKDSYVEVILKESMSPDYIVSDNSYFNIQHSKFHNSDTEFHQYQLTITTEKGLLAGIPDSDVIYKFNLRNTLREAEYRFKYYKSSSRIEQPVDDFEKIEQMLILKFGEPVNCSDIDRAFAVQSRSLEENMQYIISELGKPSYDGFFRFSEWVIDCAEYRVKIDHFLFCKNKSLYSYEYYHRLCYSYFTDDDYYMIIYTTPTPVPSPTPTINPIDDL